MSALKMAFNLSRSVLMSNNIGLFQRKLTPVVSSAFLAVYSQNRFISSQDITKNMQYISNDKLDLSHDPVTLRLNKQVDRPLCIILCWLLAKHKYVLKYASIYLEQGFDVLAVGCTPWQLLWPVKGSQPVVADLLQFMHANDSYDCFAIHGFSVGGYMWGEICLDVMKDRPKYQPVLDRVMAQTWDSAVDISEMAIGVPKSIFPKNAIMENALRKYILYHMEKFHEAATIHYMRSSQAFHRNICNAPALFLLSKSDPIGAESSNRKVHDSWVSLGIKTSWVCWDRSPHVQHFTKHPKEYIAALNEHLSSVGLISQPEKLRLRM